MMTLSRPRLESNREPAMCIMCSVSSGCCIQGELADEQEVGKHQDSCEQGQYENMSREEAIQGSLAVTTAPRPLTSARYRKTSCDNEWPVR